MSLTKRAKHLSILLLAGLLVITTQAKQLQPDVKRVKQIHDALISHGFKTRSSWNDVQEACRSIARTHNWQTHYAPDARVLILLDLGNAHSNPWVATQGHDHLDGDQ